MSSKVQTKHKTNRKLPAKKKNVDPSSKKKPLSKLVDSDLERSSSDDNFLEEFESDDTALSSSTDTDDLSQEFSDEDRLMEYYEKKLREHAIVGNFGDNSDISEDSEPSRELNALVEEIFTAERPGKQYTKQEPQNSNLSVKKAAKVNKKYHQAGLTKSPGQCLPQKTVTPSRKSSIVSKTSVPMLGPGRKKLLKKVNSSMSSLTVSHFVSPLDLSIPGSCRNRSQAENKTRTMLVSPEGTDQPRPIEDYEKVVRDYLARIKQTQNSISAVNHKINGVAEGPKILKAGISNHRSRNQKGNGVSSLSSSESEDDSTTAS